jgi:thymidylate synthase
MASKESIFEEKTNRYLLFGNQIQFDLSHSFPLFDSDFSYLFHKIMEMKIDYIKNDYTSLFNLQDLSFNQTVESFQLFVIDGKLSGKVSSKICDVLKRLPSSISIYSLLLYMIANMCGYKVDKLIYSMGVSYLAGNINNLNSSSVPFPKLKINKKCNLIDEFKIEDFELIHSF